MREVPLCLHCPQCGRRALMELEHLQEHVRRRRGYDTGPMTPLSSLRLACKRCKCREIDRWLPHRREMADRFIRSGEVDGMEYQGPRAGDVTRIVLT